MKVKPDMYKDFNNCKFKREEIAVKIIEPILTKSKDINNITINRPYGYGKTTFLEMLADYLVKKEYEVIL